MRKNEYIYEDLKKKILRKEYEANLPGENYLAEKYQVGRTTVRRAIKKLIAHGYCVSQQGKNTMILPIDENNFTVTGFKSFRENIGIGNWETKLLILEEKIIDAKLHKMTHFPLGTRVFYVERLRLCDTKKVIYDKHYFRKSIVKNLTAEIVEDSIYTHLEKLDYFPTKARINWTCEEIPQKYIKQLDFDGNTIGIVNRKHAYLDNEILLEYTESFHHKDFFNLKIVSDRKPI